MLGFSALSEVPFSQATVSLSALAILASTASYSSAGGLLYDAKSNTTLAGLSTSVVAEPILFDAKASILFTEALASISINDLLKVRGASNSTLEHTVATLYVEQFADVDAKAVTYLSNTQAALDVTSVDLDAKASITTGAVDVVSYVDPFEKIIAKANLTPTGVSSLFSLDIGYDAQALIGISGVDSLLDVEAFQEVIGKASAALVGVSFNVNNYYFLDEDAQASTDLIGVGGVIHLNLDTPDAVAFAYQADAYDTSRMVYLVAYDGSNTVHVIESNKAIYTQAQDFSDTVYITEDNRTVYVAKPNGSNTVHITR